MSEAPANVCRVCGKPLDNHRWFSIAGQPFALDRPVCPAVGERIAA